MNYYLSHTSAALAWNVPYLHVVLGYSTAELMQKDTHLKEHRCSVVQNKRMHCASAASHYKSLSLPALSVIPHNNKLVASPELVFLDLARQLGFHRTVLLGMQLCSSSPNGLIPLTSAKRLREYLDECSGHHGYKIAAQAVKYVTDNSWSVMESLLYMFLTLPNHRGGYGLKGASLNHEIILKKRGKREAKRFYADLYWEQAKLVVEYDSYQFHNTKNAWMKDSQRSAALESKGFSTISINTAQLYSDRALAEAAQAIARYLGQRIQLRSKKFLKQKQLLRDLLPKFASLEN